MKNLKRIIAFLLIVVLVFSMTGCKKTVKVKTATSNKCGSFTVSGGSLGSTGKVTLTGRAYDAWGHEFNMKNVQYKYERSGNDITLTIAKLSSAGPQKIYGTYNSSNNTFTIKYNNFCNVYDSLR